MKLLSFFVLLFTFFAAFASLGEQPTTNTLFGPRSIISDGQFNDMAFCTVLVMKMEANAGEENPATAKKWFDTMLFLADLRDDDPYLAMVMAGKLEEVIAVEEISDIEELGRHYDNSCGQYHLTISNLLAIVKKIH